MDSGTDNYRRFLAGDDNGIVENWEGALGEEETLEQTSSGSFAL